MSSTSLSQAFHALQSYFKLLTKGTANPKTVKGIAQNVMTFVLHLAPAKISGFEMCPHRTAGCSFACLNRAGRGGIFKPGKKTNAIQEARKKRTRFFMTEQQEFLAFLVWEIKKALRYCDKRGFVPAFRLNGTSDVHWEYIPVIVDGTLYANIFEAFPHVQFYDYTKAPYSARRHDIPNYDLTFSYAETEENHRDARVWLAHGHNMSVVFDVKDVSEFPSTFEGLEVINGDEHDLRYLDKKGGYVVALKLKGTKKNTRNHNGFANKAVRTVQVLAIAYLCFVLASPLTENIFDLFV